LLLDEYNQQQRKENQGGGNSGSGNGGNNPTTILPGGSPASGCASGPDAEKDRCRKEAAAAADAAAAAAAAINNLIAEALNSIPACISHPTVATCAVAAVTGIVLIGTAFVGADFGAEAQATDTSSLLPGYKTFGAAKRALGSPGKNNVFDHVVEQSQIGRSGFAPEDIHNPFNLDPVPGTINQQKANYYSSIRPFTGGKTVREWLAGQSFADQYNFGMDVLGRLTNGLPLP
jgi:hypothetical protein